MKRNFASRLVRYFIPNIGTLILVALMLFAYRASAAPALDPVGPPPSEAPQTAPTAPDTTPGTISYQGMLNDAAGQPINGNTGITFRLYNTPIGPTTSALWIEEHTGPNAVPVSNGLFNVLLGSLNPVPASVWSNANVYLGVQIGNDAEMSPREIVSPVGAAMSVVGEQPYFVSGSFATPSEWMADLVFNKNFARFCQAINRTFVRADVVQDHYTEENYELTGRGNGYFYPGWYYVGTRVALTDTHVYGETNPENPYSVWMYNGGNGCCIRRNGWTMEVGAIIWCK